MLGTLTDSFKKTMEFDPNTLVKYHKLSEGLYLLVNLNTGSYEQFEVTKKETQEEHPLFHKIKELDMYSRYINSNKSFFDKKISSINYLSLSIKMDNLRNVKVGKNWDIDEAITNILQNFEVYKNPYIKYKDKLKAKMYKMAEDELGSINNELLEFFKTWIENNLKNISDEIGDRKLNYVKIFLDCDINEYKKEFKRYLIPNILNEPFETSEGEILGVHSLNTNLNNKKPFLTSALKKNKFSNVVDIDTAINYFYISLLLNGFANSGKNLVYIGETIHALEAKEVDFNRINNIRPKFYMEVRPNNGVAIIKDFESFNTDSLDTKVTLDFKNDILIENLTISDNSYLQNLNSKGDGIEYLDRYELINLIDAVFFSKRLKSNLFRDDVDLGKFIDKRINRNALEDLIYENRDAIKSYLYKGNDHALQNNFDKMSLKSLSIFINSFKASNYNKELFLIRDAISKYFKGDNNMQEKIQEIDLKLKSIMLSDNISPEDNISLTNIDEYSYLAGQLYYYLTSLSNAKFSNLNMDSLNNILRYNNTKLVNNELNKIFLKYSHAIPQNSNRFKNLFFLCKSFQSTDKLNKDLIIAGYLSKNLMYRSYDKKKNENNNENNN